jgi:hypothetical protein
MVVILLLASALRVEGFTVIVGLVAVIIPPTPLQVSVYVTLPGALGTTLVCPLSD